MRHALLTTLRLLAQWTLAAVFLFSGFVKAADPMGMEYKLEAYVRAFSSSLPRVAEALRAGTVYLDFAVVALATLEFLIGMSLLLGIRRRTAAVCATAFLAVMTVLTAYIAAYNPVPDCGCC